MYVEYVSLIHLVVVCMCVFLHPHKKSGGGGAEFVAVAPSPPPPPEPDQHFVSTSTTSPTTTTSFLGGGGDDHSVNSVTSPNIQHFLEQWFVHNKSHSNLSSRFLLFSLSLALALFCGGGGGNCMKCTVPTCIFLAKIYMSFWIFVCLTYALIVLKGMMQICSYFSFAREV